MSERFLLYTIDDEEWHSLTEVAKDLKLPTKRAVEIAKYLAQGHFIHYNEQTGKVKLQPWVKKFPRGEWVKPGKRSTGTVIIPFDGSVTLQETVIFNSLQAEIEVNFIIIDEKLIELLISKSE